jgi:hypothetical protein
MRSNELKIRELKSTIKELVEILEWTNDQNWFGSCSVSTQEVLKELGFRL